MSLTVFRTFKFNNSLSCVDNMEAKIRRRCLLSSVCVYVRPEVQPGVTGPLPPQTPGEPLVHVSLQHGGGRKSSSPSVGCHRPPRVCLFMSIWKFPKYLCCFGSVRLLQTRSSERKLRMWTSDILSDFRFPQNPCE